MTLQEAAAKFAGEEKLERARALLRSARSKKVSFYGLAGSSPAILMSLLSKPGDAPRLIVARDMDSAGYMYHDLAHISGENSVAFFPSGYKRDIRYGQADPPQQILRTETLDALVNSKKTALGGDISRGSCRESAPKNGSWGEYDFAPFGP